jgi:hypothetical protein
LFQFEKDGGVLERLQKPIGAHNWIKAQEVIKEQEREGQDTLVSEVETNASDSEDEDSGDDDGLVLDLNITT